jgi:hypothetical protein
MRSIEALRISAPAAAQGALSAFEPWLDSVRLVLLELPEQGERARTATQTAQRLLTAADLTAVVPDGTERDASRYLLYARQAPTQREPRAGLRLQAVLTSVAGRIERRLADGSDIGSLWLRGCAHSWQQLGAPVISVAEREPPAELAALRWARTQCRPSIGQMLSAAATTPGGSLLLTNADIVLGQEWNGLLGQLHPQAVYYASRLDVERDAAANGALVGRGIFELGFDVFVLPHAFVTTLITEKLLPEELRIGEPWWDYLLPVLALTCGFPLKKLARPALALHYVHPARYSHELWLRNRDLFMRILGRLLRESGCHATGLLTELLANPQITADVVCRGLP